MNKNKIKLLNILTVSSELSKSCQMLIRVAPVVNCDYIVVLTGDLKNFLNCIMKITIVCWHHTLSCSTDQKVAYEEFAKEHGTLLALNVDNAKSIGVFSQFPCEVAAASVY